MLSTCFFDVIAHRIRKIAQKRRQPHADHQPTPHQPQMENTTTKKRATFLSTPLNSITSLNQVPGVGPVTLDRLSQRGITAPAQLIGQFMLLNRDRAAMVEWLQKECAVRQREGEMVAEALFEKSKRMVVL
jgi:predicted flap endonuclease-1-like 5' DNA nuclease